MTQETMAERARRRIRSELDTRGISQRALAERLTRATGDTWMQARVGKVLTGAVELKVDDAAAIAAAIGLPLVEVIRDQGLEFYAELTPTEVRILERIRQWPDILPALSRLLDIATRQVDSVPKRDAPRRVGRPRNSESSGKR